MTNWQAWMACGLLMSLPAAAQADIFRWDNGQLIPGTKASRRDQVLDLGARVLQFAELSNTDLTGSSFYDYSSCTEAILRPAARIHQRQFVVHRVDAIEPDRC